MICLVSEVPTTSSKPICLTNWVNPPTLMILTICGRSAGSSRSQIKFVFLHGRGVKMGSLLLATSRKNKFWWTVLAVFAIVMRKTLRMPYFIALILENGGMCSYLKWWQHN